MTHLAQADQSQETPGYGHMETAFLEFASPTLMQACDKAVTLGFSVLDVYPAFLTLGRHVGKDIPQQLGQVMEKYAQVEIKLLDYLGSSPTLSEWISVILLSKNRYRHSGQPLRGFSGHQNGNCQTVFCTTC